MPTYEYVCTHCGHEFETFQSMKDDPLTECPECPQGTVRRKIGLGAGIIFKGSGFYETDFKDRKGTKDSAEKSEKAASSSEAKPAGGDAPKPAPAKDSGSSAPASGSAKSD